jgi:hypothetical protein
LIRFLAPPTDSGEVSKIVNEGIAIKKDEKKDDDHYTIRIIEQILETGEAFFSASIWNEQRVMRINVCNYCFQANDVIRVVNAIKLVLSNNGSSSN